MCICKNIKKIYKYNGYKLKADYGGPEEVENIAKVEKEANKLFKSELEKVKKSFEQLKEEKRKDA